MIEILLTSQMERSIAMQVIHVFNHVVNPSKQRLAMHSIGEQFPIVHWCTCYWYAFLVPAL